MELISGRVTTVATVLHISLQRRQPSQTKALVLHSVENPAYIF